MSVQTSDNPLDDSTILFFDGDCGLCNRLVGFVLDRDHKGEIRFAPLQGVTAERLLDARDREVLDTGVFLTGGRCFRRSSAAIRVLWYLGGFWKIVGALLWAIPEPLRETGYRLFARNRFRVSKMLSTCRVPKPQERIRVLD